MRSKTSSQSLGHSSEIIDLKNKASYDQNLQKNQETDSVIDLNICIKSNNDSLSHHLNPGQTDTTPNSILSEESLELPFTSANSDIGLTVNIKAAQSSSINLSPNLSITKINTNTGENEKSVFSHFDETLISEHDSIEGKNRNSNRIYDRSERSTNTSADFRDSHSRLGWYHNAASSVNAIKNDFSDIYGSSSLLQAINDDNNGNHTSSEDYQSNNHDSQTSSASLYLCNSAYSILNPSAQNNSTFPQDSVLPNNILNKHQFGHNQPLVDQRGDTPEQALHLPDPNGGLNPSCNQPWGNAEVLKTNSLKQEEGVTNIVQDLNGTENYSILINGASISGIPRDEPGVNAPDSDTKTTEGREPETVIVHEKSMENSNNNGPRNNSSSGNETGVEPNTCVMIWRANKSVCATFIIIAVTLIILGAVLVPIWILVLAKYDDKDSTGSLELSNIISKSRNNPVFDSFSSATPPVSDPLTSTVSIIDSFASTTPVSDSLSNSTPYIPISLKGSIYDVSTWMDRTGFNTTFTSSTVGGLSIMGLNMTWDNTVQPNPFVPPIEDTFVYGELPIRGVNLGGWLVLEPFITPSFFQKFDPDLGIVDEWTLIDHINRTEGIEAVVMLLETHYSSFVTEDTFKEIRDAGLDHVRIPIGYWAVRTWENEHFLPHISWRYLLRGIEWARKYGIRVNLDLHSVPGGQNGWNHSGRQEVVNWLNGTDGIMYGERSLEIHTALAEFFSQDRYSDLVTIYGLVNEPRMQSLNATVINDWSEAAYLLVRDMGYEGVIAFGDGFMGAESWKGTFPNDEYPNMALDIHQYTIFDRNLIQMTHSEKIDYVCQQWGRQIERSSSRATGHGPTFVGEWSQADNDCTLYLNNVGGGTRWEGDLEGVDRMLCNGGVNCSCAESNADPSTYSDAYKQFLLQFAEAQMGVFESEGGWGSMYWTWDTETIESSQWSYKKARDAGIMPYLAYERSFNCSSPIPDYLSLGLPEVY